MRQDGFTLVEILLALAVLGMMLPLCLQLEVITTNKIHLTRLRSDAIRLAEDLMERALAQPGSQEEQGVEGPFRWRIERRNDQIWVQVVWEYRQREHSLQVVTLVAAP